jgi:transcription factor 1
MRNYLVGQVGFASEVYNADALLDLIDSIVDRVAPYIERNRPLDILDLWPGSGALSSRINQLVKPRRHVLVEPADVYLSLLKPLALSKPCYTLVQSPIYAKVDWVDFFHTHFPEQGPQTKQSPGVLPKNNSMLVLANLPPSQSLKDHYTPGRWWLKFLEECMYQNGLSRYGNVRVLAMAPFNDITTILPRTTGDYKRTGMLAEALGLHTFEVASTVETESWHVSRGLDSMSSNRKRVAERAAAENVVTPPNRELPPLKAVPEVGHTNSRTQASPHMERLFLPQHEEMFKAIAAGDATGLDSPTKSKDPVIKDVMRKRSRAITALKVQNTAAFTRQKLTSMRLHMDELSRRLARADADPNNTRAQLKNLDEEIASHASEFAAELANTHHKMARFYETNIDDGRLASISNNLDDSQLVWDRRPFEPLVIHRDEIWANGTPSGVLYFEPHEKPPALQKILRLPESDRTEALARFYALLGVLNTRNSITVPEIAKVMFPKMSTNELIQAIPSLATFADRRMKMKRAPKELRETQDPVSSYQENLEYDLSDVRLRTVSSTAIGDMIVEYEKQPHKLDALALSRVLGSSLTSAQLGGDAPALARSS